jgi:hypothetical protein
LTEEDKWQAMMRSCRKACRITGEEFVEPDYLNWFAGSHYHRALWRNVRLRKRVPPLKFTPFHPII